MDTPGKLLKTEREKKEKSLEELAKSLKIRQDYLKAIEDEDYGHIPSDVFTKGYIRAYADALGLDSSHILNLYKKQVVPTLREQSRVDTASLSEKNTGVGIGSYRARNKIFTPSGGKFQRSSLTGFAYKPVFIIAGVFLIIISLIVFMSREEKKPVSDVSEVFKEPQVLLKKEQERFSLKITATELTWISVSVDNNKPIERFLKPGDAVKWTALNGFSVKIGNAGGAKLTFNGEDLGRLGPHGKVVKFILPEDKSTHNSGG